MKRKVLYIFAAAVVAFGLWQAVRLHRAAAAGTFPELLELTPASSTMVVYADLGGLGESKFVQQLLRMGPPAQVERDYGDFVAVTGFDYQRDLDRVLVTAGPTGTVAFADGRFNRQRIEQYALRSGKLQQENGHAVYVVPSATAGKSIQFSFLSANRIALSDGGDLAAFFSVRPAATLDPAMRERLSRVAGSPIFAEVKASEFAGLASPASKGPAAGVSTPLESVRWVGIAARPQDDQIFLSAEGECDRPEDAQKVASALEFLRVILRGALADPKARGKISADSAAAAAKLLDNVKITTETVRVRVSAYLSQDMLGVPAAAGSSAH